MSLRTILAEEGLTKKEGALDEWFLSRLSDHQHLLQPKALENTAKIIKQVSHKGNGGLHFLGLQLEALADVEKQLRAMIKEGYRADSSEFQELVMYLEEITDDYPFRRWEAIGREIADTLESIEDLYVKLQ